MALVMPRAQQLVGLQLLTNNATPENLVLKLYKNDYTPVETSNAGNFTEADFTGYADFDLVAANWDFTAADPYLAEYDSFVEFVSSAGSQNQQIYGYYIVGATSGALKWAERFPTLPSAIVNNLDTVSVKPRIGLDNA